jgi:hypothetical protein
MANRKIILKLVLCIKVSGVCEREQGEQRKKEKNIGGSAPS